MENEKILDYCEELLKVIETYIFFQVKKICIVYNVIDFTERNWNLKFSLN